METWRDLKPTEKQLDLIHDMQRYVMDNFNGTTRGEACDWISKNKNAIDLSYTSDWALEHGYL